MLGLTPDMPLQKVCTFCVGSAHCFCRSLQCHRAGRVSIAGLNILAKNEEHQTKGIICAVMVETYAILAFYVADSHFARLILGEYIVYDYKYYGKDFSRGK